MIIQTCAHLLMLKPYIIWLGYIAYNYDVRSTKYVITPPKLS